MPSFCSRAPVDPQTTLIFLSIHLVLSGILFAHMAGGVAGGEGLTDWSAGSIATGVAMLLRVGDGLDGAGTVAILSHALLLAAALLFLRGIRSFVDALEERRRRPDRRGFLAVWALLSTVQVVLTLRGGAERDIFIAVALGSLYILAGWSAWHAWRTLPGPSSVVRPLGLVGLLFAILGVASVVRGAGIISSGPSSPYEGTVALIYFGVSGFVAVAVGFACAWMVFSRMRVRMEELAAEDPLTRVLNRRGLEQALHLHFERREAEAVVLLLVDIDHFKQVNDRFGHDAGDEVLREVAIELRGACRKGDFIARFGGEEFLVGCVGIDLPGALEMAERIRTRVGGMRIQMAPATSIRSTLSIGISEAFQTRDEWREACTQADLAMYRAKALGRNRTFAFRDLEGADASAGPAASPGGSASVPPAPGEAGRVQLLLPLQQGPASIT